MKIVVFTLGCKVNQYESDALLCKLKNMGHDVSEKLEYADIYILNSCAVTAEAERKSRQCVTRFLNLNSNAKVFVCGCASENKAEAFLKKDSVTLVIGTQNKDKIPDMVQDYVDNKNFERDCVCDIENTFEEIGMSESPRTRHYIKIQDGCNNFCSYCIIPYLRGRCRSRSLENVKKEVDYAQKNTKEIVLTGINLSAYGIDTGSSLTELLQSLSDCKIRVRLGSLEVRVIDREFLDATKKVKNFCPHFHLSLQSGDDTVLKSMNRHYTTEQYKKAVDLIREYYSDAAITTDIIVGFPTETDQLFENTKNFVKDVKFASVHIFNYSPREGTVAAKMKLLDKSLQVKRHKELKEICDKLSFDFNDKFIGKEVDVLFEQKKGEYFSGHTKNYITVYSKDAERGKIKKVLCKSHFENGLK